MPPGLERGQLALLHVDLTDCRSKPPNRRELVAHLATQGVTVWNGWATDISKRRVQRVNEDLKLPSLYPHACGPDDLVIVKTNLNCAGQPESKLVWRTRGTQASQGALVAESAYSVCRWKDIPPQALRDPTHVVERYVTNAEGLFHRVYRVGPRLVSCTSNAPGTIKRMGYGKPRLSVFFQDTELLHDGQPAIAARAARQALLVTNSMGTQFATVDLVQDDGGTCYVCDVNKTPYWAENEPQIEEFLRGTG